jgi:hypothetical protein
VSNSYAGPPAPPVGGAIFLEGNNASQLSHSYSVKPSRLPDGQINFEFSSISRLACPALSGKIFRFLRRANQIYDSRCPASKEGRIAIVTNVEAGCSGRRRRDRRWRWLAYGKAVWSWHPDAGVKFSWEAIPVEATVANKPGHRGATVLK